MGESKEGRFYKLTKVLKRTPPDPLHTLNSAAVLSLMQLSNHIDKKKSPITFEALHL